VPDDEVSEVAVDSIMRAFNSIVAAQDTASGVLGTSDLVANNYTLNIACYNDGVDTTSESSVGGLYIGGWTTGYNNHLRFYTPISTSEVGASQRHTGVTGTGYTFRPTLTSSSSTVVGINNLEDYVRLEGLDLDFSYVTATDQNIYEVMLQATDAQAGKSAYSWGDSWRDNGLRYNRPPFRECHHKNIKLCYL
jgi:hypothetical protein